MPSDQSWSQFYADHDCARNFDRTIHIHQELFASIAREKPKKILEAGCGTGIFSIHLSKQPGYAPCVGVDNDPSVLKMAQKNNAELSGKAVFQYGDIFSLPFADETFDVSFSQGVLEHFSDREIRNIMDEQLRVSKSVIFSVPHFFYRHKDFGNERLLTRWGWQKILHGFRLTESRGYYRIRRKRNFFLKLPQMYLAKIKRKASVMGGGKRS